MLLVLCTFKYSCTGTGMDKCLNAAFKKLPIVQWAYLYIVPKSG